MKSIKIDLKQEEKDSKEYKEHFKKRKRFNRIIFRIK